MLVKILDADDDFVESLKRETGATTASKAYVKAAESYYPDQQLISLLRHQAKIDCGRIERLQSVIEGARSAAAHLLEKTGQPDLLD